jgi:hypothetical protein
MSSFLVLVVVRLGRRMRGRLRRVLLRLSIALLVDIVTSMLSAGSRGRRLQPVHDHATGDRPKDQPAREQDRSDHAQTSKDAPHHVIRNYQRGSETERSIECARRCAGQTGAANLST